MPELLTIGYGYSVAPLASRLKGEGWIIHGTTRDSAKAGRMVDEGILPHIWDGESSLPEEAVKRADVIIVSVAPDAAGCPAARALKQLQSKTVLIYLSSSGVYGDHDGAWIDEDTVCTPTSRRGRQRLLAEQQWQDMAMRDNARSHLCRLSGIYGPGRNAVESLQGETRGAKAGLSQRIIKPGQVFNRIHRDDIAGGLYALIMASGAPSILNFADDEPSPPQDVITYAAGLLGIEPPPEVPFEEAELSPMGRSFYADNKRLRNDRLKALPGFTLTYPDYRSGLEAIIASQA
ncbi:MAG: SDR family oxidoreductase [Pseudomonadota bacterium]